MSEQQKLLSLCIPTNGIIEWVVPVLEAIYTDNVNQDEFEVVVTDNGHNDEFAAKMQEYCQKYSNMVYEKTTAQLFLNQIESFKLAKGKLIKFVNHRMAPYPGIVQALIDFAKEHQKEKPVVFFSNGAIKDLPDNSISLASLDEFIKKLRIYSSWSGGLAIWRDSFQKMQQPKEYNFYFPHDDILFAETDAKEYIIDDRAMFHDISTPTSIVKKGNYDLFRAFAVEYLDMLKVLLEHKAITKATFESIKKETYEFVFDLYYDYVILEKPCSYDLSSFDKSAAVYFNPAQIKRKAKCKYWRRKIRSIFTGKRVE